MINPVKPVKVKWWHIALVIVGLAFLSSLFDSPEPATPAESAAPEAPAPVKPTKDEEYAKELGVLYRKLKAGEIRVTPSWTDREAYDFAFDLYVWQGGASVLSNRDWQAGHDTAKLVVAEFKNLLPKLYPALRAQYAKALGERLWRDNWEIQQKGRTIIFINARFSNNAEIEDAHKAIKEKLYYLRFDRAEYKWIASDPRYNYYTIESPPDSQVGP